MAKKTVETSWQQTLDNLVAKRIFPQIVHRVLLYGPHGTGKSTWAEKTFAEVERIPLHKQMTVDDLIGGMGLVNGSTVFQPGIAPRCMIEGKVLVLDEIDQYSPEIRCHLNSILDDREIAGITLPDGKRVRPSEGFAIVATTNVHPSAIHEVLLDRFDLILCADKPAQGLFNRLSDGAKSIVANHYGREQIAKWTAPVSARTMLAFDKLASSLDNELAAGLLFGEQAQTMLNAMSCAK